MQRTDIGHSNTFVFDRMAAVFTGYPQDSIRCLGLHMERNQDGWFYGRKREAVWNILEMALKIPGDIHDQAEELVHKLGSMGYLQYRELLTEQD